MKLPGSEEIRDPTPLKSADGKYVSLISQNRQLIKKMVLKARPSFDSFILPAYRSGNGEASFPVLSIFYVFSVFM